MTTVIETRELGKKYGHVTALEDCTLSVPEGQLVALVGPNGAGKSTLLNLVVGLAAPTSGEVSVLDGVPAGSPAALDGIAFVAQDMPLYRNLSAVDLIHLTRNLNLRFDDAYAHRRLQELAIPERPRTAKLSGGQRAQLALTLALARHPRLLVLDEPTAALDPLARHDFMAIVMAAMVEDGVSVMLSSHVLAELERVADHLILISHGRVHLDGAVEDLLGRHRLLTGPRDQAHDPSWRTIQQTSAGAQSHLLVEMTAVDETPRGWEARPVSLEELAMAYLRGDNSVPRRTDLAAIR
jgi:ABC-2 type transport system ATP-binding protein